MANIADTVKLLRAKAELTQAELADRAGIHRRTVQDIEAGTYTPRLVTCVRLARALGVPVEDITEGNAA